MRRGPRFIQVTAVVGVLAAGFGFTVAGAPADAPPVDTTPTGALSTPPAAPVVNTAAATAITTTGATAAGSINAEGLQTSYRVQYGRTTKYGEQAVAASAGSGTAAQSVSAVLTGLHASTIFHYRVVAQNADGTTAGSDATFRTDTPAPAISRPAIVGDTSQVSRSGSARLISACIGGTRCSGSITLTHNGVRIGTCGSFTLAAHATKVIHVAVNAYGRKLLRGSPSGVAARVTILNGDKPLAHKHVTLEPAKRPSGQAAKRPSGQAAKRPSGQATRATAGRSRHG
jgi:alkylated DNA nucleotide flippase Atl1